MIEVGAPDIQRALCVRLIWIELGARVRVSGESVCVCVCVCVCVDWL